jgi:hypothetical protein
MLGDAAAAVDLMSALCARVMQGVELICFVRVCRDEVEHSLKRPNLRSNHQPSEFEPQAAAAWSKHELF